MGQLERETSVPQGAGRSLLTSRASIWLFARPGPARPCQAALQNIFTSHAQTQQQQQQLGQSDSFRVGQGVGWL